MPHQQHAQLVDAARRSRPSSAAARAAAASSGRPSRAATAPRRRTGGRHSAPSAGRAPRRRRAASGSRRSRSNSLCVTRKPWNGPSMRRPAAHARAGPGPLQVDRRVAAAVVPAAVAREVPLVRAPAELGRLAALADEAVDRPGVDELARRACGGRPTWVSRSAMWIALTPRSRASRAQPCAVARRRRGRGRCRAAMSSSACLTKLRDQAGVGAMRQLTAVGPRPSSRRSASALSRSA